MKVEVFRILAYEPQQVSPGLKILSGVIGHLAAAASVRLADLLRPELMRAGLAPLEASPSECAAKAADLPEGVAARLAVPEEQLFMVDSRPYEPPGRIPETLEEFARLHRELSSSGAIAVTVLNTACAAAAEDFRRLAATIDEFPAMVESTWVLTSSLREPVPAALMALVAKRRGGRPAGKAGKYLAVTEGLPHLVPIGESIALVAQKDCQEVILDRLKHLRKWGSAGSKKGDGLA